MAITNPELQTWIDDIDQSIDSTATWRAEERLTHSLLLLGELDNYMASLKKFYDSPNMGRFNSMKNDAMALAQRAVYISDQAQEDAP